MLTIIQLIETELDNFANLLRPHKLWNAGELGLEVIRQKQNINAKNARHVKENARHDIDGLIHKNVNHEKLSIQLESLITECVINFVHVS